MTQRKIFCSKWINFGRVFLENKASEGDSDNGAGIMRPSSIEWLQSHLAILNPVLDMPLLVCFSSQIRHVAKKRYKFRLCLVNRAKELLLLFVPLMEESPRLVAARTALHDVQRTVHIVDSFLKSSRYLNLLKSNRRTLHDFSCSWNNIHYNKNEAFSGIHR